MDYIREIITLLNQLDKSKLKCVYLFIKGMLD